MTCLGLVLHDDVLIQHANADFDVLMTHPEWLHNMYEGDIVKGWVRSLYSRAVVAYLSRCHWKSKCAQFREHMAADSMPGGQAGRSTTH